MLQRTNISKYGYTGTSPFRACPDFSSGRSGDEVVAGNVLTPYTDHKYKSQFIYTYSAYIISSQDYFPLGMQMPNRGFNINIGEYRFGFCSCIKLM